MERIGTESICSAEILAGIWNLKPMIMIELAPKKDIINNSE